MFDIDFDNQIIDAATENTLRWKRYVSNQQVLKSRWARKAQCCDTDPNLMYPSSHIAQLNIVNTICVDCSVKLECLDLALMAAETHGVWGGTTEDERSDLIKLVADVFDPKDFFDESQVEVIHQIARDYLSLD